MLPNRQIDAVYRPTFGDALRKARRAAGMTQDELGYVLGVTGATISHWETGDTIFVPIAQRKQVIEALNLPSTYFDMVETQNDAEPVVEYVATPEAIRQPAPEPKPAPNYNNPPSSPHNGITSYAGIKPIDGASLLPSRTQYVVGVIQALYKDWLDNNQYDPQFHAHWWFYLAQKMAEEIPSEILRSLDPRGK